VNPDLGRPGPAKIALALKRERYKVRKRSTPWHNAGEPYAWRCPGCRRWRAMEDGGADDLPHLCDRCWCRCREAAGRRREIKRRNLRRLIRRKGHVQ
jgi:hypothetical protein